MSNIERNSVRQFSSLELFARHVVEGFLTGLHKSPFHGFSVEFAEHRQYNRGESIKHIDWKLYGRTEKLFVKKYEEETNLRCQLVLDVSSSMYFPFKNQKAPKGQKNKLDFAVHAAASLAYLFRKQRDAIGLATIANSVEEFLPAKGSSKHRQRVIDIMDGLLEQEKFEASSNLANGIHEVSEKFPKRSLVVIFTDLMESGKELNDLFDSFHHLRHNKHEVILFHVMDKNLESDLNFADKPTTFIDPETNEQIRLNPISVRNNYRKSQAKLEHTIDLKCGQYGIDYQKVDISEGFYSVLLAFLSKRSKMT